MAPPVVFADANVLYSSALRDLLMQLAVDGTIVLRWSDAVQDEWTTAVLRERPELVAGSAEPAWSWPTTFRTPASPATKT